MLQKNFNAILSTFLIFGITYFIFYRMMPSIDTSKDVSNSEFSSHRALKHVEVISKEAHYVNTENHQVVFSYLERELKKLGLETYIQEGDILSKWNNLVHTKNLVARIKGHQNSKALLLLSHYDSAPHSNSKGASDDGNGLAVILEGIRAFKNSNTTHKNDIIIVFSDGEELGLNGAFSFVKDNPWSEEVGLVINFEARGTSGPSMMLVETNGGNATMINAFADANPKYPVSNSLMYSIYKMLPNDTDLTAFRETKGIQGFNFAYIDDHFNYHTVQDDYKHFSTKSLAHQASYLMPLLSHFSNTDLTKLTATEDQVYFNTPLVFVHYSNAWNLPLLILAFVLFIGITIIGLGKRLLDFSEIIKGFMPFIISLLFSCFVVFFGWKFLILVYPKYEDMLHGFTYNGHDYIAAFVLLTLSVCFWIYGKMSTEKSTSNHLIVPIFIWFLLSVVLFFVLEGASFFIIPVYFSLFALAYLIFSKNQYTFLPVALAIPTLIIIAPFIYLFPVGLGLKVLFGSAILTVLLFTLLLSVFGQFPLKKKWSILLLIISSCFFIKAHFNARFEKGKGKPNSLVYVYDATQKTAKWATYDKVLDDWTRLYLGKNPLRNKNNNKNSLSSKYNSSYSYSRKTALKKIASPRVEFVRDTIIGEIRSVTIVIFPNRKVERIDVFANEKMKIHHFKANGIKKVNQVGSLFLRKKNQLLSFYPKKSDSLELSFQIKKGTILDMDVMTASFDLLENKQFNISNRPDDFIPMPFVLNDAIIVQKKINTQKVISKKPFVQKKVIDSLITKKDSIEIY